MPTSSRPERLVVDANPILAALLGGMARRILFETAIREFAVPEVTMTEVRAFLPRLALTLRLGLPLWSNDRDFGEAGIEYFTTARLLAMFFGTSPR